MDLHKDGCLEGHPRRRTPKGIQTRTANGGDIDPTTCRAHGRNHVERACQGEENYLDLNAQMEAAFVESA